MDWIDCTHTIRPGMIQWPTDTPFEQRRVLDMETGDEVNVTVTAGGVHIGTHIDAPLHFVRDAVDIASIPLETLCGPATVVQITERRDILPGDLDGLDDLTRVLFRTPNEALWRSPEFSEEFIALSVPAAERLVAAGARLVGIDYVSVDRFDASDCPVHHVFGRAGVVVIENVDLSRAPAGQYELMALPMKLGGAEGAPARVLLRPIVRLST